MSVVSTVWIQSWQSVQCLWAGGMIVQLPSKYINIFRDAEIFLNKQVKNDEFYK